MGFPGGCAGVQVPRLSNCLSLTKFDFEWRGGVYYFPAIIFTLKNSRYRLIKNN